jgi:uncharacterized membrane protein
MHTMCAGSSHCTLLALIPLLHAYAYTNKHERYRSTQPITCRVHYLHSVLVQRLLLVPLTAANTTSANHSTYQWLVIRALLLLLCADQTAPRVAAAGQPACALHVGALH